MPEWASWTGSLERPAQQHQWLCCTSALLQLTPSSSCWCFLGLFLKDLRYWKPQF